MIRNSLVAIGGMLVIAGAANAADAGADLYAKKCASCHGKAGEGNAAMEKMLKTTIKPLSDPAVQGKSDEQLGKDITEGSGKMKGVAGLSEADVKSLVAVVRSFKK